MGKKKHDKKSIRDVDTDSDSDSDHSNECADRRFLESNYGIKIKKKDENNDKISLLPKIKKKKRRNKQILGYDESNRRAKKGFSYQISRFAKKCLTIGSSFILYHIDPEGKTDVYVSHECMLYKPLDIGKMVIGFQNIIIQNEKNGPVKITSDIEKYPHMSSDEYIRACKKPFTETVHNVSPKDIGI